MVSEGYPYFDIWPPGEREEYFVYEYLESFLPSVPTFGYDVGSEPPANSTSKPLQAAA